MTKLYLDSSEHLVIGFLNDKNDWISYEHLETKKNSKHIHRLIYEQCLKNKLEVSDISLIIQNSGPGSYTGMRLTEGLTQVFEWQDVKAVGFYHFEVPKILGIKNGRWISKAFKKELFIYEWEEQDGHHKLIKEDSFQFKNGDFTHFSSLSLNHKIDLTNDLIYKNSQKLFNYVIKRNERPTPFYYRALEEEFTPSNI